MRKNILICISGASANYLALKMANVLKDDFNIHLVLSNGAKNVLKHELGLGFKKFDKKIISKKMKAFLDDDFFEKVCVYKDDDLGANISSGSFLNNLSFLGAFFYVSCDMVSDMVGGKCDTLIKRAFFVCQKQKVRTVLSPREMPYTNIYLKNLLKLSKSGSIIAPPILGSYFDCDSLKDMEGFILGKWCDSLGVENNLYKRWSKK